MLSRLGYLDVDADTDPTPQAAADPTQQTATRARPPVSILEFEKHPIPSITREPPEESANFDVQSHRLIEWAALHRADLLRNWELARAGKPLEPIEPLE